MLRERLGLSERRACQITGQHRSTQRHQPRRGGERDDALRERLRRLSAEHPRWGYRLAWGAVHLALLSTGEDRAKAMVDWTWAGFTHERPHRIDVETEPLLEGSHR